MPDGHARRHLTDEDATGKPGTAMGAERDVASRPYLERTTGKRQHPPRASRRLCGVRAGNERRMSEALTPEEETIETDLAETLADDVPVEDEYDGPDPEDDPKGDGSDEDQGT